MVLTDVLTTLLPAAIGLIGVGVGASLSERGQHRRWLREQKVEAISAFVENAGLLVDRFLDTSPSTPEERIEWLHGLQSGRTTIHLLCGTETRRALSTLARRVQDLETDRSPVAEEAAITALRDFVEVARDEIHPTRPWGHA